LNLFERILRNDIYEAQKDKAWVRQGDFWFNAFTGESNGKLPRLSQRLKHGISELSQSKPRKRSWLELKMSEKREKSLMSFPVNVRVQGFQIKLVATVNACLLVFNANLLL